MSTNLNKQLSPETAENIIKSGLDVMIISLDGLTQEVYETYRVGGRLERVLDNIKLLVRKKKELGYITPNLEWQFIVMRQNEFQMDDARRMAVELGVDSLVFKKVDFPHGEKTQETAERWLPREHPEYLRGDPFSKPYQEDGDRCWRLWRRAVVNWDGGLAPCCYLTDKAEDFGDAGTTPVKEIWTGEQYTTARGLFKNGYVPEKWVGCASCGVYLGSQAARKRGPMALHPEPAYAGSTGVTGRSGAGEGPQVPGGWRFPMASNWKEESDEE
jgi:MoaA/NifB/PqqE/SkfB family radical SAM enzyme